MEEQEYIITLYNADDWDQFHEEMLKNDPHAHIPDRCVLCANDRPFSETQSHYMLTKDEAAKLAQDPRVMLIELNPLLDPTLKLQPVGSFYGTYDRSSTLTNVMKNWGLIRSSTVSNPFTSVDQLLTQFNYNLAGRGVDVVVIDTGIAENHPEFSVNPDGSGGSRVVDFDWSSLGVTGIIPLAGGSGTNGFLGDADGHGSNCASIAAGNTCGWAREAKIYSIRAIPSSNNTDIITGNTLGFHDINLVFDLVKAFHLSKPIEDTGFRRPTICTNSWTFTTPYQGMVSTIWRGVAYPTSSPNINYGQISSAGSHCARVDSLDISIASTIAAGVIVLGASGNFSHKVDVEGGIDYNNYWYDGARSYYYHRGGTPGSSAGTSGGNLYKVITVGALDNVTPERKASFSETGPGVDLYAPGRYITGAGSTRHAPYINDSRDTNLVYKLSKMSGSSMACPQAAGMMACVVGARPWMTHNDAKDFITGNSLSNVLDQNSINGTGYSNLYYLQTGSNKLLYTPFNSSQSLNISNIDMNLTIEVK